MVQLEDGTGKGFKVKVDSENRLRTLAITHTAEFHANESEEQAYHVQFDQSPTANDDCIFYLSNDTDEDLIIEGIWLQIDDAGEIYFQINDVGTRNAGVVVVPTNVNAKSGNLAQGTFEQGPDLDGGVATLAGGVEFERYIFAAAINSTMFNFEADVVLGRGNTLTIWCNLAIRTIHGTIVFYFHPET